MNRHKGSAKVLLAGISAMLLLVGCTQEQQNVISRDIQNWTGTNGVLELYAGDKVVRRFLKIDKLSTAMGTQDNAPRPYRMKGTSPSQASRRLLGLRFTATECQDGEAKLFINSPERGNHGYRNRWN